MDNFLQNMKEKQMRNIKENIELYILILPVLLHIFIFHYIPLYGIVIAFQDYYPGSPFIAFDGSVKWVGLKHIIEFIKSIYFVRVFRNTILLSFYGLVFGFWVPIVFALLLNELANGFFKKFVQTASYLPHFISNVVVAGMVISFISTDGIVNDLIVLLGGNPIRFNIEPRYFRVIYTITSIWKSFGWSSILYLSSISSIDPNLYESARIDGANRFHQVRDITIPSIMPTILILLIFSIGSLLGSNTEMILLLYSPAVYETADVIGTYLYRDGLLGGRFSFGTAVGLFTTVINFALLYTANTISRKRTDYALW
ncbi:MAG: sugar ABC transporter permease [Firmicutes bacterium]|nr:sugar ABC transporter permease [Bacillota bacterium]